MVDWSKVGRSSRRKGHTFERLAAKLVNKTLGTHFHRTPASGGHAIEGDLYEAPGEQTAWSRFVWYCRTGYNWTWEGLLARLNCGPRKWITETGPNTIWLFRTRPGCVFVCILEDFVEYDMRSSCVLFCDGYAIITLQELAKISCTQSFWNTATALGIGRDAKSSFPLPKVCSPR